MEGAPAAQDRPSYLPSFRGYGTTCGPNPLEPCSGAKGVRWPPHIAATMTFFSLVEGGR